MQCGLLLSKGKVGSLYAVNGHMKERFTMIAMFHCFIDFHRLFLAMSKNLNKPWQSRVSSVLHISSDHPPESSHHPLDPHWIPFEWQVLVSLGGALLFPLGRSSVADQNVSHPGQRGT